MIKNLKSRFKSEKFYVLFAILYLSSFFYPRINVELGFSLKSFMVFSFLVFMFNLNKFRFYLNTYDYIFIFFIIYASLTVPFSLDIIKGIRIIFGSLIILFCYFVAKFFFIKYILTNKISLNKIIIPTIFIYTVIVLVLYIVAFILINGNYIQNEHNLFYGILVERAMPRLVGLHYDPNIAFFHSLIFFYYLYFLNNKSILEYILLFLLSVLIILTLSTGGIISIVFSLSIYYLLSFIKMKNKKVNLIKFIKYFLVVAIVIVYVFFIFDIIESNEFIANIVEKRIDNLDKGSGRYEIWQNGLSIFCDNPFFGIGWFNFLQYNIVRFGRENYMHNTFLETLVETGILGFLIYLIFFIVLFFYVLKLQYYKNNKYLLYSFLSILVMMNSLSLYIDEVFFIYMVFVSYEFYKIKYINIKSFKNDEY